MEKLEFSWYDYGMFGLTLSLSALIGVYFGFVKKQTTTDDYLHGGKNMSFIPISASLIASIISGVTLLAIPTDIYRYGITYWFSVPMLILTCLMTYLVYMPVFYELQVTSTFEYLKLRFDGTVRSFASAIFTLHSLMYLSIVVYVPALALSQATGVNIHIITPIICGVCIFYTSFGGLKAVVWTDALQFIIMVGSIITAFCLGISSEGGWNNIWQKNLEQQRLDVSFSMDPTKRDTFWTAAIGLSINWVTYFTYNQGFVQKCIALPNYKAVRNAIIIFAIGVIMIISLSVFTGMIMFAKYSDCDPFLSGGITQPDQLLPFYIMDIARNIPGLPGIFTAGIFSAALSTISATINSLCASIYEDFLSGYFREDASQETISKYLKVLAIALGAITIGLVYLIPYLGTIMPLAVTIGSIAGTTLLGLFTSAMLIPAINAKGALYGGIIALVCVSWMAFGAQYYKSIGLITYPPLPLSIDGCRNISQISNLTADSFIPETPFILYRISFYYYSLIGTLILIIAGLVISKLTPHYNRPLKKKYFSPVIGKWLRSNDRPPHYDCLEQVDNKFSILEEKL